LTIAPQWAPIVVNSLKSHTKKILDVWSEIIKKPMSMWVSIINTSKSRKHREKERETTHKTLFTQFGPLLT